MNDSCNNHAPCIENRYNLVRTVIPAAVQGALGLSGVEGVFRTACNTALSVLRGGATSLTALLTAIVHDPLVDWGAEGEGAAAKKVRPSPTKPVLVTLTQISHTLGTYYSLMKHPHAAIAVKSGTEMKCGPS